MKIKVLGTGCANCKETMKLIADVAAVNNAKIELEKVEDMQTIMSYGIMSTPGVVINEKVVHSGGIPGRDTIAQWLQGNAEKPKASNGGCGCSCN
ncbi:MAG: thioredoxin family protein [bacterium]